MRALYRYQREHYRKITIRRELYDLLRKLADERGRTIPDLIKDLVDTYIGTNIGGNIGGNTGSSPNIGGNIGTNIGSNIGTYITASPSTATPGPPPSTTESTATTKTEDVAETHIWCRKKSEIRNLKGFLEWVDHNYRLLDWWEEGEKYCFETERKPEKGRR